MLQSNINARLVFDNAVDLLRDAGYSVDHAKLTQSEIRSEVKMSANATKFHLPIVINDNVNGNAFNTEKRLQLADVAIVYAVGLRVGVPLSDTDGNYETFTYPNLTKFPTTGTAAAVRGAYSNGWLALLNDNQQVEPYWALSKNYKAPKTQQGANVGYATSGVNLLDSVNGAEDGIYPVEGSWILSGNSNLDLSINIPTAMPVVENFSRWICTLYVLLAQNCSKTANRG